MIGRKRRADKIQEAAGGVNTSPEEETSGEVFNVHSNFYTERGSAGNLVTYAQYDKSYVAEQRDFEQPVDAWRRAIIAEMWQWVENNAPGGEKDALLALEMPGTDDGTLSGGAFLRWDAAGEQELYSYFLQKSHNPETGAQELTVTGLTRLEVDDRTAFPAPKGSQMTMSMRGRADVYDGKQVEETPERQSYERSLTTALREAVDQYKIDNDPQLPKGTTRHTQELSTGGRELLLKRYSTPGNTLKTLEAVTGRTVTSKKGEWVDYKGVVDELDFTDLAVELRTPDSQRWGECMVVYPVAEDGSRIARFVRRRNGMHDFTLHIAPDGDTIVTAGKPIKYDPSTGVGIGEVPAGTRIIAGVRGHMAKGDAYDDTTFDADDRTPDERLLMEARQAIQDKKTAHAA